MPHALVINWRDNKPDARSRRGMSIAHELKAEGCGPYHGEDPGNDCRK
jgi:hypothetical protein